MNTSIIKANAGTIAAEMQWLIKVIDTRMKSYWGGETEYSDVYDVPAPDLSGDASVYAGILKQYNMNFSERLILALALAPHLQPQLLDVFFIKNADYDRGFTEFGGIKGQQHAGFIPTGETAAFLLSASSMERRLQVQQIFADSHFFKQQFILSLQHTNDGEPFLSGRLALAAEYLRFFTTGETQKPDYNVAFPAKLLQTELNWDDLVLDPQVLNELMEINTWLQHGETLLNDWGMRRHIKPGYKALFHGPPGTGKTLAAALLGKSAGLDVYRIDLSMIVSKYIGETEKNIAAIFTQAQHKNWILFFDEADALFGKRTQVSDSHDRYANQEIAYLLQRIEDFPGVVLLASNLKVNLDEAFARRLQSVIHFPMPGKDQRKQIWEKAFSAQTLLEEKINLDAIAEKYELAGGAIINVCRYCSLQALQRNSNTILLEDIITGIRREFSKEGK